MQSSVDKDWEAFVNSKKIEELNQIISDENLDKEETYKFIQNAFRDGGVVTGGTALGKVLPPVSIFSPGGERAQKRESVVSKLTSFFERFFDISGAHFKQND